jgi:hypothetical protein
MPLPRQLVYNDLSGEEVRHVLEERFSRLLSDVPYLQKHLTLPRVKMTLTVHLDVYADQPNPERHTIHNDLEVKSEGSEPDSLVFSGDVTEVVNASPGIGGKPPDQIRDEHNLGIPVPTRGSNLNVTTLEDRVEGRRITSSNGSVIDRTGNAPERSGATVIVQDFGKAGLADGQFNRPDAPRLRGGHDGQGVSKPVFGREDK